MRNEIENYKQEITGKVRFLQAELSDAKMEIADYKKRTEELENKVETQDLKIDHLEKMLDEKILETEMQKMTIEGTKSNVQIPKPISKTVVSKENYGLNKNQMEAIAKYG